MPNILFTNACNRQCPYCFAKEQTADPDSYIDFRDFIRALDFLERSGIKGCGILGGEPTLHPEFVKLIRYGLNRGFVHNIFSNAVCETLLIEQIETVVEDFGHDDIKLYFTINLNEESIRSANEQKCQDEFFRRLNRICRLSFNVWRPDIPMDFRLNV